MADEPIAHRPRTVLYEELAEYYYTSIAASRLKHSDLKTEIRYHLHNITLLSLYFDHVLITSATIFNVRNDFVSSIISGFLEHRRVREMLQHGVLKIVGWGSNRASGMLDAASNYAEGVLSIKKNSTVLGHLSSIFTDENVISRSPQNPDSDLSKKYIDRLTNTTFVSNKVEIQSVFDAVERQHEYTGSLIAIEMLPSLDKAIVSEGLLNASKLELFGVTIEHMRGELPDLWVYSPFLAQRFALETTHASQGAPRAFLLSPMIFGSFLSANIDARTFDLIMNQSYHKLEILKNGDWRRFVEAYHQAVQEVSDALSLTMHLSPDELENYKSKDWADRVVGRIEKGGLNIDIAAFVESLGSLGGIILGVPALKPVAKLLTSAIGTSLSNAISRLSKKQRNQVSPFILKLEKAYVS